MHSRRIKNNWHIIKGQPLTELDKKVLYYQQGKETDRIYGSSLYEFNIKWRIKAGTTNCVEILDIQKLKEQKS